jgi:hypothetical protein
MSKTFVAKPGDKWTKHGKNYLWLYRDGRCRIASESGLHNWYASFRGQHETDLTTPDAHAQLREWGYEVSGDEKPITEARVKEIVAQMLAAQPTQAEVREVIAIVREAIAIANDPNTKWHDVTEPEVDHDDWRAKCKVWQPTPNSNIGEPWAAHSPSGKWSLSASSTGHILGWDLVGGVFLGRNFKTEADARAALAKAPPPPDVDDFNGLKEAGAPEPVRWSDIYNTQPSLRVAIEGPIMAKSPAWTGERVVIMDAPANIAAPEPDWKGLLEAVVNAPTHTQHDNAMTAAASALTAARTNGGGK